jgi:hypothetical protein
MSWLLGEWLLGCLVSGCLGSAEFNTEDTEFFQDLGLWTWDLGHGTWNLKLET